MSNLCTYALIAKCIVACAACMGQILISLRSCFIKSLKRSNCFIRALKNALQHFSINYSSSTRKPICPITNQLVHDQNQLVHPDPKVYVLFVPLVYYSEWRNNGIKAFKSTSIRIY